MQNDYHYPGEELALFEHAVNWKNYFRKVLQPYIRGSVLEVGAGIGATTAVLNQGTANTWTAMEPDAALFSQLQQRLSDLPSNTLVLNGDLSHVQDRYDTILYIDVLEHIERDQEQVLLAAQRLNKGGHLIVLSPAFQMIYSPFDKAIGHYRRYTRKSLGALRAPGLSSPKMLYLDSMGFFASVANRAVLSQKYPTKKQIGFWDRLLIPISRTTDKLFFHSFGKTIIGIWTKE